jgi:hypothetical protein
MSRAIHLHYYLHQLSARKFLKKQNTLIRKQICLRNVAPPSKRNLLFTHSSMSFFSSLLAAPLFPSNTASPFPLLLPYCPLAPMCYPSHYSLPISLHIPHMFPQTLVGSLRLTVPHNLCPRGLSVLAEVGAPRRF